MKTLKACLILAASAGAITAAPAAHAETAAWEFTTAGNSFTDGSWNFGNDFTVSQAVTVTALGYYNDPTSGVSGNPVALYNSNGTLLAQATVNPGDMQVGHFLYASLASSVTLAPGQYQIDGVSFGSNYTWNDAGFSTAPGITVLDNLWSTPGQTTPDFQTTVQNDVTDGIWGPNLLLSSAPGPVPGAGLAGLAALALAGFYARTRRA